MRYFHAKAVAKGVEDWNSSSSIHDLPVQDLRGSIKIEEGQHGGISKVKKKTWKTQVESTCQRKKKKQIEVTNFKL